MENVIPVVVDLKKKLANCKSPLRGDFMHFLCQLMKDYKDEIEDVLAADRQLMAEIEFDIKRFEQQQRQQGGSSLDEVHVQYPPPVAAGTVEEPGSPRIMSSPDLNQSPRRVTSPPGLMASHTGIMVSPTHVPGDPTNVAESLTTIVPSSTQVKKNQTTTLPTSSQIQKSPAGLAVSAPDESVVQADILNPNVSRLSVNVASTPVQDKVEDVVDVQKTGQDCQVVEQADVASQVPSESALADGKAEEAVGDPVNQVAQVAEDTDDCRCHSDSARSCDSSSRR